MCINENMFVFTKNMFVFTKNMFVFTKVLNSSMSESWFFCLLKKRNFGQDQFSSKMSLFHDCGEILLLLKFVIMARCNNLIFNMYLLCMLNIYHRCRL